MQLSNAIRQRIINLSEEKQLSLREVSNRSKVPYQTIITFMSGKTRTIRIGTLFDICNGLDIELIDFFSDDLFKEVIDEKEEKNYI